MSDSIDNELVNLVELALATVPEVGEIHPHDLLTVGDQIAFIHDMMAAAAAALYFAAKLRRSTAKNAILERMLFMQEALKTLNDSLLSLDTRSSPAKEG
jgi:hypothetical protein